MKKLFTTIVSLAMFSGLCFGQFNFSRAVNAAKSATSTTKSAVSKTNSAVKSTSNATSTTKSSSSNKSVKANNGTVYYVNPATGSNRNDGKSPSTAFKEVQKLINSDFVKDGDVIRMAEGNYLGYMNSGYVEVSKYITLQGGWNSDFTAWDPVKYQTMIQPTAEQKGTNGSKGMLTLKPTTPNANATMIIDGLILDMGMENDYMRADPKDERTGTCEGCETGRMLDEQSPSHVIINGGYSNLTGNLIIKNCIIMNGNNYGIQLGNSGGHWEIYNNIFVANRYAACEIRGAKATSDGITVDFHHNTVLFSWCRTKLMEDMGYGFRFMNGLQQEDVHHNIFGCSNLGAIDNCRFENTKEKEAKKIQNVENNLFFMNNADMVLPAVGGGKWLMVKAEQFEDVDRIKGYEGNRDLPANSKLLKLINQPQLKGFANLKMTTNTSYDRNSAQNQFRSALGMNQVGTETVRVSMYGNRYPLADAVTLFGAEPGYGAQTPVK